MTLYNLYLEADIRTDEIKTLKEADESLKEADESLKEADESLKEADESLKEADQELTGKTLIL